MFPCSFTDSDVQLQRHQDALTVAMRARLTDQARPAVLGNPAGGAIRTAFGRVGTVAYDSREGLRSKEQDLAAYGITWTTDLGDEEDLARELQAARQRRLAGVSTARLAEPPARAAVGGGLRWGIGELLVRAGRRLQGAQPVDAAALA